MPTENVPNGEPTREPVIAPAPRTERFLGMTKIGWLIVFVSLLIVTVAILGTLLSVKIGENSDLAKKTQALAVQGVQSHNSICALADDLRNRIFDETVSLARTKAAFRKNPNLLPNVPKSLIEQGWKTQQRTIDGQTRTVKVLTKTLGTCPR